MKKFIAMFMCAALMACVSVSAQDIYKTAANVPMVQLNNGVLMPQFGLGTFMQPSDAICKQSCLTALKAGYRHIDTAHAYNDERGVGEAVKESGIPREEIWITSKLWPTEYGEGKTLKAIDEMLARLQTDYIDLLYVHQPVGDFVGAWKDMEKAVAMGKVRALGISNFDANDEVFNKIMSESTVKPAVLQIECHPYAQRLAMRKTAAQVILRWHIQEGFSAIPGATNPDYIEENIRIFDFELTDGEMAQMRSLDKEQRFFNATLEQVENMVWNAKLSD